MKKTKVIIPALGILLLSTAASVTGTVAWFSTNSTVSATGMTIKAKTDSNFLVIVEGSTFNGAALTTSVTSTHAAVELYPVAPKDSLSAANAGTYSTWHYTYSDGPNKWQQGAQQAWVDCTEGNLGNYVASETFSIGLAASSAQDNTDTDLELASVTLPAAKGISCVVVCGSVMGHYTASNDAANLDLGVPASKDGTTVTVYYYLNGNDENVFSNNILNPSTGALNLTGAVTLVFDIM